MGTGVVLSLVVLTVVHFAAFALLFWHLAGREMIDVFRIGPDDDRGHGRGGDPAPPEDPPAGDRDGGLPLPAASPSQVRLREPGRIAEGYPRRPRRPAHAPVPERVPAGEPR